MRALVFMITVVWPATTVAACGTGRQAPAGLRDRATSMAGRGVRHGAAFMSRAHRGDSHPNLVREMYPRPEYPESTLRRSATSIQAAIQQSRRSDRR